MLKSSEENQKKFSQTKVENLSTKMFFLFFEKEELRTTLQELVEKRQLL